MWRTQKSQVLQVDVEGFDTEMKAQRQRSKDSAKSVDLEVGGVLAGLASNTDATVFSGYYNLHGQGHVVAILRDGDSVSSASEGMLLLFKILLSAKSIQLAYCSLNSTSLRSAWPECIL